MSIQLGDVPSWLGVSLSAVALWQSMIASRRAWVVDWGELVGELSGLTSDEIKNAVESTPAIAEIVGTAWEAAARSADEEKRRLLARVASAALRGDEDVALDELQFFVRTLRDVEPAHVRLLGTIARLTGDAGKIRRPDLESHWQASAEFLTPMLQLLAREGLIGDASNTRQGISFTGVEEWLLSAYGARFLKFLDAPDEESH